MYLEISYTFPSAQQALHGTIIFPLPEV